MTRLYLRACTPVLLCGLASIVPVAAGNAAHHNDAAHGILRVDIVGLRNANGKVHCTLFNSPGAFPDDASKALKDVAVPIKDRLAWCNFKDIPPGKYAIVTFHDENDNGEFDADAFGLPLEGYAFSNNVRPISSKPDFKQCAFDYRGGNQTLKIKMRY